MSRITHILQRLESLKDHAAVAREVIQRGDQLLAIRIVSDMAFNMTSVQMELRRFSPKAFTSATEHLRK
jgi:hypothetical protein